MCHRAIFNQNWSNGCGNMVIKHFYRAMLCIRGTSHGPVSVCLSVSVTSRSSTKTAKRRITQTTPHDSPGLQFSAAKDLREIRPGSSPTRTPNAGGLGQNQRLLTNNRLHLENGTRQTHTTTTTLQPFNGLFSRTTWVSLYQKGKTNLDFTEARDSEWQCHQLDHMQVCTSLQT